MVGQGWDSPMLKLWYLSLWLALFQWKTVIEELGESQPRNYCIYMITSKYAFVLKYDSAVLQRSKKKFDTFNSVAIFLQADSSRP